MAWFGTNLASLKTQISNFTKDVLIEDTIDTHNQLELPDNQSSTNDPTQEIMRQEVEASQYQAKKIAAQYRALLQEKEDEVQDLKRKLNERRHHSSSSLSSRPDQDDQSWSQWNIVSKKESSQLMNENKDEEIKKLTFLVASKSTDLEEMEKKIIALTNENEEFKEKLYTALKTEGLYLAELQNMKENRGSTSIHVDELSKENATLKQLLEKKNEEILTLLKQEPSDSSIQANQLLLDLEHKYKDMLNENSQLKDECLSLRAELDEKKTFHLMDINAQAELDTVKAKLLEAEDEITLLEDENNDLRDRLESTFPDIAREQEWLREISAYKSEIQGLKDIIQDLNDENDQTSKNVQKQLAELQTQLLSVKAQNDELNKDYTTASESFDEQLKTKEKQVTDMTQRLEQIQSKYNDESHKLKQALTDLEIKNVEMINLDESLRALQTDYESERLKNENVAKDLLQTDVTNEHVSNLEKINHDLLGQMTHLNAELERVGKLITNKDAEILALNSQLESCKNLDMETNVLHELEFQKKTDVLVSQLDEMQTNLSKANDTILTLSQQIKTLENEKMTISTDLSNALQANNELQHVLTLKEQDLTNIEEKFAALTVDNKSKCDELNNEVYRLTSAMESITFENSELSRERSGLETHCANLKVEYDTTIKTLQTEIEAKEEKICNQIKENFEQAEKFRLLFDQNAELHKKYEALVVSKAKEIAEKEEHLAQTSNQILMLQEEINLIQINRETPKECAENSCQTDDAIVLSNFEHERLKGKYAVLSDKNEKMSKEMERLKSHLVDMETSYDTEILGEKEKYNTMTDELNRAHTRIEQFKNEIKESQEKYLALTVKLNEIETETDKYKLRCQELEKLNESEIKKVHDMEHVLQRMQKEKEKVESFELNVMRDTLSAKEQEIKSLQTQLVDAQNELKKLGTMAQSFPFLNQRLAEREHALNQMRATIIEKENMLKDVSNKITLMEEKEKNHVEKDIIKNLFMKYLTAPTDQQRIEIGFLLGKVLNFTHLEIEKLGNQNSSTLSKWTLGNLFFSSPAPNTTTHSNEVEGQGLGKLFIKFLEEESLPKTPSKFDIPPSNPITGNTNGATLLPQQMTTLIQDEQQLSFGGGAAASGIYYPQYNNSIGDILLQGTGNEENAQNTTNNQEMGWQNDFTLTSKPSPYYKND